MKKILLKIIIYFRKVNIYQSKNNLRKKSFKNFKLFEFESFEKISSKKIQYFLKKNNLIKNFTNGNKLLALKKKNSFVALGWKNNTSSYWKISEIDKYVFFKKKIILFNFFVFKKYRQKGYYSKMLSLIKNLNTKKKFIIYALDSNKISNKGIIKADFKLLKRISKFND